MYTSYQYNTQVPLNSPIYYNNSNNMSGYPTNYNVNLATNDPSVLCVSGNAFTIKAKGEEVAKQGLPEGIKSIRINMTGNIVQPFNLCCWLLTIIFGSIFVFPLFFICCDWWKRMTWQTFSIDFSGYEGVAKLIQYSGVRQVYLTVQDNYFNSFKAQILIQALSRSRIQNFSFSNVVQNFNAQGNNESTFDLYMRPILQYVRNAEISWGRKFVR